MKKSLNRTNLGVEKEEEILLSLDPIINKYAKECNQSPDYIKSAISYLWSEEKRESDEKWQDWLSANEIGPYGGR